VLDQATRRRAADLLPGWRDGAYTQGAPRGLDTADVPGGRQGRRPAGAPRGVRDLRVPALRERLRCKKIWVVGADRWRNPDEDLPHDFEAHRAAHYAALRKPLEPTAFIDQLRDEMRTELAALDTALPNLAWLEIANRGWSGSIKLTDLDAAPEPRNLRHLTAEVRTHWSTVPLIDLLKEAVLHRLPGRGDRPRRSGAGGARGAAAFGHLRLRHQHRYPRDRRQRPARPLARSHGWCGRGSAV
jgi:hypothetical protein